MCVCLWHNFLKSECPWIVSCHAICPARCGISEGLMPECSIGVKKGQNEEVNARMATADHDRQGQAVHRRCKSHTVVAFTSGKGCAKPTLISTRDSAHNFIVQFSPSVCVALVAFLDQRNGCTKFVVWSLYERPYISL